jgi:two-component system sensor histidine kinase TctE
VPGIDLGLERNDETLQVLAQPGLLKEALSNLLHNAIRYTPPGGQVTLQVARLGQGVTIAVIDNGPGIPAAELEHAGDRFFRGSNIDQPGSGLGLAIVRSIVERLHGSLLLAAGPQGRGLAVTLSLPLAVDAKKDQG